MELFDKKFVHFMWDDSLEGKQGFFTDDIYNLVGVVESNEGVKSILSYSDEAMRPFKSSCDVNWKFFYHDPLYEYKWAYKQGKKVEVKGGVLWHTLPDNWYWDDSFEYRVVIEEGKQYLTYEDLLAKEQLLTNEQLSEWLAKGNGMFRAAQGGKSRTLYNFREEHANDLIDSTLMVRKWREKEWHRPTVGYCFPNENREED